MVKNPNCFAKKLSNFIQINEESINKIVAKKEQANTSSTGKLKVIKKKLPLLEKISLRSILPKPIYHYFKSNLTKLEESIPKEDFSNQHKQLIHAKYS